MRFGRGLNSQPAELIFDGCKSSARLLYFRIQRDFMIDGIHA